MQTTIKLLILSLLVASSFCLYGSNSNVIQLDENNFNNLVINSNELWIVEFYAPWCGHCKNLAPEWEKAANALKGIVKIGAVDCDKHKNLGGKYGVKGFPTIKYFGLQKNTPKDYESGRTASDIVKFAVDKIKDITSTRLTGKADSGSSSRSNSSSDSGSKKSGSSDKDVIVLTDENFDKTINGSKDMWLVEFYAPWCGHCKNLEPEWNIAATDLKGKVKIAKVDATVHSKVASRFGVKGYPTIKIFPPGDKKDSLVENYDGGRTADVIVTTALEKLEKFGYIPDIEQLTNNNKYKAECVDSGKTCIIAFLPNMYDSSAKERNKYLEILKQGSTVGRGKPMTFLWAQGGDFFDFEDKFGMSFGFPAVLVVNNSKKKYSTMKEAFDVQGIKSYINKILIGKESFYDVPAVVPALKSVAEWDGKDMVVEAPVIDDL